MDPAQWAAAATNPHWHGSPTRTINPLAPSAAMTGETAIQNTLAPSAAPSAAHEGDATSNIQPSAEVGGGGVAITVPEPNVGDGATTGDVAPKPATCCNRFLVGLGIGSCVFFGGIFFTAHAALLCAAIIAAFILLRVCNCPIFCIETRVGHGLTQAEEDELRRQQANWSCIQYVCCAFFQAFRYQGIMWMLASWVASFLLYLPARLLLVAGLGDGCAAFLERWETGFLIVMSMLDGICPAIVNTQRTYYRNWFDRDLYYDETPS
jgi:hypothetical protein